MLRSGPISTVWSSELAYVIGLIASDGNLSKDSRHINLTSKDEEMTQTVKEILGIRNKITKKSRAFEKEKKYFFLQFGSVDFYRFLLSIGLTPAKSKTLKPLKIPPEYFFDFLRGCIDGDGSIVETRHPESQHLQLRVILCSASIQFLQWIQETIHHKLSLHGGWIYSSEKNNCSLLSFGKTDSIMILKEMYKNSNSPRLDRKYHIASQYLD